MPEDVRAALERFQQFIAGFEAGTEIDGKSGFTTADAMLLVGEVEMAASQHRVEDENPIE